MIKLITKRPRLLAAVISASLSQFALAQQIEEVLVTAQKRSENVQDVPIAIQAFSAETLTVSGVTDVEDLGTITPGLQMNQGGVANSPFIRGLGSQDASAGQDQSVATYVDGVLQNSVTGSAVVLNNIERVEVLKGPQGTLFGRNTTGGVINIITKDPSSDPSLNIKVGYGNYEMFNLGAYGTTGIAENLAADLAFYTSNQGKGFGKSLGTGNDVNRRTDEYSVRSKWKFSGETFEATLIAFYEQFSDDKGYARRVPDGLVDFSGNRTPSDDYDLPLDTDNTADFYNRGVSLKMKKELDMMDVVSITAFNSNKLDSFTDNDFSDTFWNNAGIWFYDDVLTQEIQFLSNDADSKLTWIAGIFLMDQNSRGKYTINGAGVGAPVVNTIELNGTIDSTSVAAFGEVSYAFTDATKLTVGLRGTEDQRKFSSNPGFRIQFGPPTNPALITTAHHGFWSGGSTPVTIPLKDDQDSWTEPTYRIVLDHQFNDNVMVYASFNHGFRSGNYVTPVAATPAPFNPEKVDAFEVGMKSDLMDGSLRLNASAYYYKVKDLQLQVLLGLSIATINAAKADISGFDWDATWQATDEINVVFGGSYTDGEYKDFPNAPSNTFLPTGGSAPVTGSIDASGNQITGTPEWLTTGAINWVRSTDAGRWSVSLRGTYNDGFPWEPDGQLKQDSYTIVNMSAGWRSPDDKWGVQLTGKNLLDEVYSVTTRSTNVTGAFFAPGNPRLFSVSVDYTFD